MSTVAPAEPVAAYDPTIDAFWAAVSLISTWEALDAPAGGGRTTDAPDSGVEPPVRSLPITAIPERSIAATVTFESNESDIVPLARSSAAEARRIGGAAGALPLGAGADTTDTKRPAGGARDAPDGLPARSVNEPAEAWTSLTMPPVSLCSPRAAAAWPAVRRISSMADGDMDENEAPASGTGSPPGPESDSSPGRADCGLTCSSNSSASVPRPRSRAAGGWPPAGDARAGPVRSGATAAGRPRAAGIAFPARSAAAPRAMSTETDAAGRLPCASSAACTAALWSAASARWADGPCADEEEEARAPASPMRTVEGAGEEAFEDTATANRDGSIKAASTCSSNGMVSTPVPMSRLGERADPGSSASGPVSSGTTEARPRSIPPYALPDRSVRLAACASMSISEAAARTASAFWSAVILINTDCEARPPPARGIDGPYAETEAPESRTRAGPPTAPPPPGAADPSPTSETPDALRSVEATYSSNATTTAPPSRSTTGGADRAGGASSAIDSISIRSRPAKALPDTSRTAPLVTVRCTEGGIPVRPPPTRAASRAGPTRTRSSAPSSSDARTAPASETVALAAEPDGVPVSTNPDRSAPAASMYSSNGIVSRPCDTSSDGRTRSGSAGGTESAVIETGALDRPANRRPAASETAADGRSSLTGPASIWALATAPFWAAVRNMRSVSSSTVRYCTSGPDGGTTRAPDRGTRLAPPASSIAAPDRSIPAAGMCSVNMIESTPLPMSRDGSVPGRIAGGTESSTTVRFALPLPDAGSAANALPDRSAMPLPCATAIRSGPAVAFAARSAATCPAANDSSMRAPPSPPGGEGAGRGDCAAFPSLSDTVTA